MTTHTDPRGTSVRMLDWVALVKLAVLLIVALGRPLLMRRMRRGAGG